MQHPIFGKLEQLAGDLGSWYGSVRLPFFSRYTPERRDRQGDYPLSVINAEDGAPSAVHERAFTHFLQNQDAICYEVIQTIFLSYQTNWGDWLSGVLELEEDRALPELQSPDDLKKVIEFTGLYVFADSNGAVLGFCFGCTWDIPHGLGVLVREGHVIEIGENDLCWSGPQGGGLPFALGSDLTKEINEQKAIAAARIQEQKSIAAIKSLGGVVTQYPVMGIDFRDKPINDGDLAALKHCLNLRQVEIAGTKITDAGLKEIRQLEELETLDLSRTAITDAGLKELRDLKNLKRLQLLGTEITDFGLGEVGGCKSLVTLNITDTKVSDAGVKEIRGLARLQHLELARTLITDTGLLELWWLQGGLVTLDVSGTPVTDAGSKMLKAFKSLRYLNLGHTKVSDAGIEPLKDLQSLRTLHLVSTAVTDAAIAELRHALPKLQVIR